MSLERGIVIQQWDELVPEAVLHLNNTTNASSKFSPFQTAYGIAATTPLDNKLGCNQSKEPVDTALLRLNVAANKEEAKRNYQTQANRTVRINEFRPGDLVLLKRTHGSYPKMNPIWVGPYLVIKKIGPVNWSIMDPASKKTKIVHHDLLKPGRREQDASITLDHSPGASGLGESPTITRTTIVVPHQVSASVSPVHSRELDQEGSMRNVMNGPATGTSQVLTPDPCNGGTNQAVVTRSGRTSRPVQRLGIDNSLPLDF